MGLSTPCTDLKNNNRGIFELGPQETRKTKKGKGKRNGDSGRPPENDNDHDDNDDDDDELEIGISGEKDWETLIDDYENGEEENLKNWDKESFSDSGTSYWEDDSEDERELKFMWDSNSDDSDFGDQNNDLGGVLGAIEHFDNLGSNSDTDNNDISSLVHDNSFLHEQEYQETDSGTATTEDLYYQYAQLEGQISQTLISAKSKLNAYHNVLSQKQDLIKKEETFVFNLKQTLAQLQNPVSYWFSSRQLESDSRSSPLSIWQFPTSCPVLLKNLDTSVSNLVDIDGQEPLIYSNLLIDKMVPKVKIQNKGDLDDFLRLAEG